MPKPPIEFSYHVTGNFYAGTYPFAQDKEAGLQKLQKLLDFGIKHFIDLTMEPLTKYSEFLPSDCTYTNLPTRDYTVPTFEDIKKAHDFIRQSKEKVYLHCKGGYDRTGVTVATYFIYQGKTPEEAKKLFRKVSKPVKDRYANPPLIETDWDVLERYRDWLRKQQEPRTNLRDQIFGGILGLAVADALGVPVEFQSREQLRRKPVTDMRGYGSHNQPPGTWSDDTSMTLCLLDSLTQTGFQKPNYDDIMRRFLAWYDQGEYTAHGEVFDMGNTTRKALQRFKQGAPPLECGGTLEGNNGNGSLMRILPMALCVNTPYNTLFQWVHNVSSLTHAHKRSQIACGIYVMIARLLLTNKSVDLKEAIISALIEMKDKHYSSDDCTKELKHFNRLFKKNFAKLPEAEIESDGYVVATLEAAIWCLLNTDNYKDCVLKAVNLGIDTDTTAAVAGGLAGMYYGVDSIPKEWLAQLVKRDYIEELCEKFFRSVSQENDETEPQL